MKTILRPDNARKFILTVFPEEDELKNWLGGKIHRYTIEYGLLEHDEALEFKLVRKTEIAFAPGTQQGEDLYFLIKKYFNKESRMSEKMPLNEKMFARLSSLVSFKHKERTEIALPYSDIVLLRFDKYSNGAQVPYMLEIDGSLKKRFKLPKTQWAQSAIEVTENHTFNSANM